MKNKSKKIGYKILKIVWIIAGILISIWTTYWFVRVRIFNDYGLVVNVIMFAAGFYSLFVYIAITLLFLLIKFVTKKIKKKK